MNESKTLLFLSVDISGSTEIKMLAASEELQWWLQPFARFFREFPLVLMGQIALHFSEQEHVPEVSVWRTRGDEIIFVARPMCAVDAVLLIKAFYDAILAYDEKLFANYPLRIKGCGWSAVFPVPNIEIEMPEIASARSAGGATYIEYLGPDVDTGFRISKFSRPGRVIVSMELAEILAGEEQENDLRFHYVGREVLKGVFAGRPYPLIWISRPGRLPDVWEWESEECPLTARMQNDAPMPAAEVRTLVARIRRYLNKMCNLHL